MRRVLVVALISALGCGASQDAGEGADEPLVSGSEVADHMRTLSSDDFQGRGPGHVGGELASDYIAEHFAAIGLVAPNGSHFQTVPMVGTTTDPTTVSLSFVGPAGSVSPRYLDEFVLNSGDPDPPANGGSPGVEGTAEVVFVGYGIDAPENDWDDFGSVDVDGKFIMILVNDPPAPGDEPGLFGGPAMTYYGRWTYKYEEAARQGALGALIVHETSPAGYPWTVVRGGWSGEQFALPPDPSAPAPAGMVGWITLETARAVLAAGGHDFDDLKARASRRGFKAVPTGVTASAGVRSSVRRVDTRNVVGLLPGGSRPDEYVTATSHYDHFGIGEAVEGDSIYNGAYDNASGTALLMSLATTLARRNAPLERSVLFIATAAEEQGLLGAQWYVQSPLFPLSRTAAEINVDGANLWGITEDMIVQGEERSGLGDFVRARATEMGLTLLPDAEPEKGFFFRSDHFPFAKAGVPSLYVEHGRRYVGQPEGWGTDIQAEYTARRYHAPSDEYDEAFVFDGAVQQGELVGRVLIDVANDDSWPNWHEGQEFKAARDAMMSNR